jgi:hypothetical protein
MYVCMHVCMFVSWARKTQLRACCDWRESAEKCDQRRSPKVAQRKKKQAPAIELKATQQPPKTEDDEHADAELEDQHNR